MSRPGVRGRQLRYRDLPSKFGSPRLDRGRGCDHGSHRGSSATSSALRRNDQARSEGGAWSEKRQAFPQGVSAARPSGRADRDAHSGQTAQPQPALSSNAAGTRIVEETSAVRQTHRDRQQPRSRASERAGPVGRAHALSPAGAARRGGRVVRGDQGERGGDCAFELAERDFPRGRPSCVFGCRAAEVAVSGRPAYRSSATALITSRTARQSPSARCSTPAMTPSRSTASTSRCRPPGRSAR